MNKPPAPTLLTKAAKRKLRLNKMFRMRAARPAVPHAAPGPEHRAGSAGSGAGASKQGTEPTPEEEIEVILDLLTESDSSRPASPADAQLRTPPFPRRSPAFAPPRRRGRPRSTDPAFLRRRPLLPSLALCVPPWRGHAPRPMNLGPCPPALAPVDPRLLNLCGPLRLGSSQSPPYPRGSPRFQSCAGALRVVARRPRPAPAARPA